MASWKAKLRSQPSIRAIHDSIFGQGNKISIAQSDGSSVSLELYDSLPFLLIRKEQHNSGTAMTDYRKVVPVTFLLDLGKPADDLRTMGTAGLTAPDQNPGSYLFLTLATLQHAGE